MAVQVKNEQAQFEQAFTSECLENKQVKKKNETKSQALLRELTETIQEVKSELADAAAGKPCAKSGGKTSEKLGEVGPEEATSREQESLGQAMAAMVMILQNLQVEISQYAAKNSTRMETISEANITVAENNLVKVQNALAEIAAAEKKKKKWGLISKIVSSVVAALVCAVAAATGNVALFAITATMYTATMTGAFEKAGNEVGKGIYAMGGISREKANLIGGIIVVAVVMAVAWAATPSAAAEGGSQTAANAAASKATQAAKLISRSLGASLIAGATAAQQTGVMSQLFNYIFVKIAKAGGTTNSNTLDKVKMASEICSTVALILVGIVGGAGLAGGSSSGATQSTAQTTSRLAKAAQRIKKALDTVFMSRLIQFGIPSMAALAATSTVAQGTITMDEGKFSKDLGIAQANLELNKTTESMIDRTFTDAIQDMSEKQKANAKANVGYAQKLAAATIAAAHVAANAV